MASEEINTTPDWLTMEMLSNILSLEVMSAHQHVTSQEISVSERIVNITHGPDLVIAHFKQHNPPSTAPVANLREVAFSQLVRQKKNHGICVSMETIAFVQKKCSIHITARDRSNNTGLLRCFFHYDLEEDTDLRSFLPLGSKIIVKEPFCDIINGQVVLTIEHPCDLALICNDVTLDMHPSHFSNLKERFQYDETPQAVQNPGSSTKNPENPETDLPHAPFTGPIMLHDFGPKGHGYKATAPIVSGQLLLRERAFATAHQSLDSKTFPVILDHDSETILVGSQARVVSSVLRKLWSSAEGRQDFSLFHHPRATRGQAVPLVDGQPVISSYVIIILTLPSVAVI